MRYAEIIKDDEDPVVQMAQDALARSKNQKTKNQIKVKQAQERKLKQDLANRQKLDFKESDPDLPETTDPRLHTSRKQKSARDIAKKKHEIWIDEVGLEE
jgi:hypothetical protein